MTRSPSRWKDALAIAARKTIAARRQALLLDLARARQERERLHAEPTAHIGAIRKCGNRIYDLEQLCLVLSLELKSSAIRTDQPSANVVAIQR